MSQNSRHASLPSSRQASRQVATQVQQAALGSGVFGVVRPYRQRADASDSIRGLSAGLDAINYLQRPEFESQEWKEISIEDFLTTHSHMFTQFDKSQLPENLVIKIFNGADASIVVALLLLFDRFQNNMDVTSLPQTPLGDCPCIVFDKNGAFKGVLMRRLLPVTDQVIKYMQSSSTEEKRLAFSHVWDFANGLLAPISADKCLHHGDIHFNNFAFDTHTSKFIVIDYDRISVVGTAWAEGDLKLIMTEFEIFARDVNLFLTIPKSRVFVMPSNLDEERMDMFLHYSCIKVTLSAINEYNSSEDIDAVDPKWHRLLRMLLGNMSRDSGCSNGYPVFDKSSVEYLEVHVNDQTVNKLEIKSIQNCRLLTVTLFLYLKVFIQQKTLQDRWDNCLFLFCDPINSCIDIKYGATQVKYKKADSVIEVLLTSLEAHGGRSKKMNAELAVPNTSRLGPGTASRAR